ncbi:unnamed protein product [Caretta caretta]
MMSSNDSKCGYCIPPRNTSSIKWVFREKDYPFFWQGKSAEETQEEGVGFAIKNSLLGMIEPPTNGSKRILALCLFTSEGPVNLVSVYATTLSSSSDIKDQFYNQLNTNTISKIPKH